jgi:hypothetical protein
MVTSFEPRKKIKFIQGKSPPTTDDRNLKMNVILRVNNLPPIPETFDLDAKYVDLVDKEMFLNDTYGDCVTAEHAHQTYRFERFEQGKQVVITNGDVKAQYFKETGGGDNGLNMLTSLKIWRQDGFLIGGKIYKIFAFATVDWKNHDQVKLGCMLFNGVCFGMQVPKSAMDQHNNGMPWTVLANDGGIEGGHAVYMLKWLKIVSINAIGPVILTWGSYQQATWEFWDKYVDEAYVIIDDRDSWVDSATNPLNIPLLQTYLSQIGNLPNNAIAVTTTSVPNGTTGKQYSARLGAVGGTPPYIWSIYAGTLNPGLSLSQGGAITGIPTVAGTNRVTFLVTDSVGSQTGVILNIKVVKGCVVSKAINGIKGLFGGK